MLDSRILDLTMDDGSLPDHWTLNMLGDLSSPLAYVAAKDLELDARFKGDSVYLYWLTFSPTNDHLVYVSQDLKARSTAAIFKVDRKPKLEISKIRHGILVAGGAVHLKLSWSRSFNMVKFVFHPHFPLLAFAFADMLYLWNFTEGETCTRSRRQS